MSEDWTIERVVDALGAMPAGTEASVNGRPVKRLACSGYRYDVGLYVQHPDIIYSRMLSLRAAIDVCSRADFSHTLPAWQKPPGWERTCLDWAIEHYGACFLGGDGLRYDADGNVLGPYVPSASDSEVEPPKSWSR